MKPSMWTLVAFVILIGSWAALPSIASSFQPTTFKNFERNRPPIESVPGYKVDSSRPGLSLVVSQSCEVRPLPEDKKVFLDGLGVVFGRPDVFALYTRELRVEEQGVSRWIPFQDATLDHLLRGSCERSEIGITVRFLAVHSELGRIYTGIGYRRDGLEPVEPVSCFATELLGVEIGSSLEDARARLRDRYGREVQIPPQGQRRMWGYEADPDHRTTLFIGDSGNGPRRNVFSVQVWGPPNPDLELPRGLRLGQDAATVHERLGPPVSTRTSPEGYELLSYEGSPCSVELKDGVLASVLVLGDPNYFEE